MFPEKIQFDGEKYQTNELRGQKKEETNIKSVSSVSVPGAGIEPARPLLATGF